MLLGLLVIVYAYKQDLTRKGGERTGIFLTLDLGNGGIDCLVPLEFQNYGWSLYSTQWQQYYIGKSFAGR